MPQSNTAKAVILARGLGKRMREAGDPAAGGTTDAQAQVASQGVKAMIPIDRPFLDYVLTNLADAGYRSVCLVIGPEHDQIRDYYTRQVAPERVTIDFAIQAQPRGTADAVAAAEAFAGRDAVLVINSDNYYPLEAFERVGELAGSGLAAFNLRAMAEASNIEPERLSKFGLVELDEHSRLRRVIEKPDDATRAALGDAACVSMNCWRFTPAVFEACRRIEPSPRGEYEITDAVNVAMSELGEVFEAVPIHAPVLDMSYRHDIASVTERLAGTRCAF
ncbi:MAG: sugar phosphate nucleotidyltransferase [Phycisphaeraceae bacterium]